MAVMWPAGSRVMFTTLPVLLLIELYEKLSELPLRAVRPSSLPLLASIVLAKPTRFVTLYVPPKLGSAGL